MKIDLSKVDPENFMMHSHVLGTEAVHLIQPVHIGTKWTWENRIFRSSVWNNEGELVSASLPKFTNWGENPEHFPVPNSLNNLIFVQKVDGSALIVSKYKGQYILRTRGTLDASKMEKNGDELEIFKATILPKLENDQETWPHSFIFEWVSPKNRIVIYYPEPDWYLVGVVNHKDYSLVSQHELNDLAKKLDLKRPPTYQFSHAQSISELIADVDTWRGAEGIVVYSKDGQKLHKVKSADYLARHRLKSELSSFEKLVDFWVNQGMPSNYHDFLSDVYGLTDWETAMENQGNISRIIDAKKDVDKILDGMKAFVNGLSYLPNRKEQAARVISSYGTTNRASFVFKLLDNKPLTGEDIKKLLYQAIKK